MCNNLVAFDQLVRQQERINELEREREQFGTAENLTYAATIAELNNRVGELEREMEAGKRTAELYAGCVKDLEQLIQQRDRYRAALERIANPLRSNFYFEANDGDDVVVRMRDAAREALGK